MTNDREVIASESGKTAAGFYGVFTLAGVFAAVTAGSPLLAALFVAIAVGLAVLAYRAVKSRLEIDDRGVTAATDRFTRRLTWNEVNHFEYRGLRGGLGASLTNGRWVRLQDYGLQHRAAAQALAHRLEDRRMASAA